MHRKLTITVSDDVYRGLHQKIGRGQISCFIENLVRPHVVGDNDLQGPQPLDPEIVALLPQQGEWSDADYLWLSGQTNRLVELADGSIEVLPMPTKKHQAISRYLFLALLALMRSIGGDVFYAPLRLRIRPRTFREPDLLLVRSADDPRAGNEWGQYRVGPGGRPCLRLHAAAAAPHARYEHARARLARAGRLLLYGRAAAPQGGHRHS